MIQLAQKSSSRRGVILLIVMALLATFAIVAVTFFLSTAQVNVQSSHHAEQGRYNENGHALVHEAVMAVVRGTSDTAIQGEFDSLLGDMYGEEGEYQTVTLTVAQNSPYLTCTGANNNWLGRTISVVPNADGTPCALDGLSGFIVKVEGNTASILPYALLHTLAPISVQGRVVLNPLPFQTDARDYDAADDNNRFLAARDPETGIVMIPSYTQRNAGVPVIPSAGNGLVNKISVDTDNDGFLDSGWIDLGLPVRPGPDGRMVKPLVAVLVEDLDGRLNPNAHGQEFAEKIKYWDNNTGLMPSEDSTFAPGRQWAQGTGNTATDGMTSESFNETGHWGQGRGPAEVAISALMLSGNNLSTLNMRKYFIQLCKGKFSHGYKSIDENTTVKSDRYASYQTKGAWYQRYSYGTRTSIGFTQATPLDYRGTMAVGVDMTGAPLYSFLNTDFFTKQVINMSANIVGMNETTKNRVLGSPYDVDLGIYTVRGEAQKAPNETSSVIGQAWLNLDAPYSPAELEAVLRRYDDDSMYLPRRLFDLVTAENDDDYRINRHLVTTDSWSLPVIRNENMAGENFSPETRSGMPMDLLRLAFVFSQVRDNFANNNFARRQQVAGYIYQILEQLNVDMGGENDRSRNNAQWAVNVVDFFDGDDVMTPFEYTPGRYVYGVEYPELLLTETVALHSRNTENDPPAGGESAEKAGGENGTRESEEDKTVYEIYDKDELEAIPEKIRDEVSAKIEAMPEESRPDGVVDLDQRVRPQGSLFIELFNPRTNSTTDTNYRQEPPGGTETWSNGGVNLAKKSGNDSVWRIVIMRKDKLSDTFTTGDWNEDPDENLGTAGATLNGRVERVINLAPGTQTTPGIQGDVDFVYSSHAVATSLAPGRHAVIGPSDKTVLSFNDAKAAGDDATITVTRSLRVETTGVFYNDALVNTGVVGIPVAAANNGARLSLTEEGEYPGDPGQGDYSYDPDTLEMRKGGNAVTFDKPFDAARDNEDWRFLAQNRGRSSYRIIHLQRLANPASTTGHNAQTNPYITVDSMAVDLYTYNARSTDEELDDGTEIEGSGAVLPRIVTRKRGQSLYTANETTDQYKNISMLWRQEGHDTAPESRCNFASSNQGATGAFTGDFSHAFGSLGRSITGANSEGKAKLPFETFPMTRGSFSGPDGMPAQPIPWLTWLNRPPVSPAELMLVTNRSASQLLRNFDVDSDAMDTTNSEYVLNYLPNFRQGNRHRVLDYFRVPSLQMVTPSLINSSTNPDDTLPFAFYSMYREPGRINLNTIYSEKVFRGLMARPNLKEKVYDPVTKGDLWVSFLESRGGTEDEPWKVPQPFKSAYAARDESIYRKHPDSERYGLFENMSEELWNSTKNQAYFRYQNYMRLSNMATVRSNVYAVWVTVGLFETQKNGNNWVFNLNNLYEYGAESGNQKRYRGFYIIDRSIPVGYIRGKDLNVDKAILLRRFL
ncbi:MAG: hypothetical protein Q4C96_05850 [Planctomycetia bacterium]|nr:hypothetical protein [Planctomycetia bacterium]